MPVFTEKLDELPDTVARASPASISSIAAALAEGRSRLAVAVGSGGSAVAAEYLAACRRSVQRGPTLVQTPLEFTLGTEDLSESQVWLFSARGNNPDVEASFRSAVSRGAGSIQIVTSNGDGALARSARGTEKIAVHVVPVADEKDGFLATHSLVAALSALLLAADCCSNGVDPTPEIETLISFSRRELARAREAEHGVRGPGQRDLLLLLHDPRLASAAVLIETSFWEACLCPVQRTDFRNFAHGRHVWLAHRPEETVIRALTGSDTRELWSEIEAHVPAAVKRTELQKAYCGRREIFSALIEGFAFVESVANSLGVDAAKPGPGPFAKPTYEARGLERLSYKLGPALRHKSFALGARDRPGPEAADLAAIEKSVRSRFANARFGGLVLDYDGTVVTNDGRFDPPRPDVLAELERLLDDGLRVALATGRGGSVGEVLRELLPERHFRQVLVGYYNGAYLRTLDVDIRTHRPDPRPGIDRVAGWLKSRPDLFRRPKVKDSGVQLSVDLVDLVDPSAFSQSMDEFIRETSSPLRTTRSQHSFDVVPEETCKTAVVRALGAELPAGGAVDILCIGDSGAEGGNDHVLLGLPFGISVGEVCARPDVCWSIFGPSRTGPDALSSILEGLRRSPDGVGMRLDFGSLGLAPPTVDVYKE